MKKKRSKKACARAGKEIENGTDTTDLLVASFGNNKVEIAFFLLCLLVVLSGLQRGG